MILDEIREGEKKIGSWRRSLSLVSGRSMRIAHEAKESEFEPGDRQRESVARGCSMECWIMAGVVGASEWCRRG